MPIIYFDVYDEAYMLTMNPSSGWCAYSPWPYMPTCYMLSMLLCFGLCAKFFICFVHLYACTSVITVIFLYGSKAVYFLSSVDPPVVRVTGGGQVKQGSYVTLTCDVISGSQSGPIRYAWTYNGRNRNSRLESDVVVTNNRIRWGSDKETKDLEENCFM